MQSYVYFAVFSLDRIGVIGEGSADMQVEFQVRNGQGERLYRHDYGPRVKIFEGNHLLLLFMLAFLVSEVDVLQLGAPIFLALVGADESIVEYHDFKGDDHASVQVKSGGVPDGGKGDVLGSDVLEQNFFLDSVGVEIKAGVSVPVHPEKLRVEVDEFGSDGNLHKIGEGIVEIPDLFSLVQISALPQIVHMVKSIISHQNVFVKLAIRNLPEYFAFE